MKLYIAYGSNMDLVQMNYRCPESKFVDKVNIPGYRLMFKHSKSGSYATIEPEINYNVPAILFEISENDEARLDRYEGFPIFYHKETIEVEFKDGKSQEAMAYVMRKDAEFGMPTAMYYDILARAYVKFNFDFKILSDALKYSFEQSADWRF